MHHFRPEFLNRLDDIIIFQPLTQKEIAQIVTIQLKAIEQRLQQKHLTLELSTKAIEYLSSAGYDPVFGARPLKRLLQQEILDPLSLLIIEQKVAEGDTVVADLRDGSIVLKKR